MANAEDAESFINSTQEYIVVPSSGVPSRFAILSQQHQGEERFTRAFIAVSDALLETRRYLAGKRTNEPADATEAKKISDLWKTAGALIREYDSSFGEYCIYKAEGWADESLWNTELYRGLPLKLDEIRNQMNKLNAPTKVPQWFPVAAVVFTAFSFIGLFYLLVRPQDIPTSKHFLFDVWVAFSLACSATFIGGTAQAWGKLPFFKDAPVKFFATGGIGIFVVVLIILHFAYP